MSKTEEHETLLGDCETVWELYVVGYDEDGNQCRYGENVREVDYNPKWTCPCCREICSCNSCPCYYAVYNSRRKHYLLLNVLSAAVDFPTCDFIRMSLSVGKTGLRTLAVVTKADKSSEGLLEKILPDDFKGVADHYPSSTMDLLHLPRCTCHGMQMNLIEVTHRKGLQQVC
ncbi:uncharacterized protein LOC123920001 [Trifolium pratense]|uniref:uncharacterized protein LOC123920001 n=1 Tax=Trifolium pratense TaxID=57577 RepID=UPI001E69010B|nr:uncharacterized protein LOC123920001 [Trifolium pratense]XP_045828026.1 uncharacterized protein LOC123920001 [Trifolium pratense]